MQCDASTRSVAIGLTSILIVKSGAAILNLPRALAAVAAIIRLRRQEEYASEPAAQNRAVARKLFKNMF